MIDERCLATVIRAMIDVLPDDHCLIDNLKDIHGSVAFAAPDNHAIWYEEMASLLLSHFGGDAPKGIERSMVDIWMGRRTRHADFWENP